MKKRITIIIIAAIVAAVAIVTIATSKRNTLFYQNLEALSIIEEGHKGKGLCWETVTYVENHLVLICGSCIFVEAEETEYSLTGHCN